MHGASTSEQATRAIAPSARQSLRIAYLLPTFPELSNTFVLNQITGMIDRGHEVDIYALESKPFAGAHQDVADYRLDQRMRHLVIPRDRVRRLAVAARRLASPTMLRTSVWAGLSPLRHGARALSLVPLFTHLSFARERPYDVLHCQFGHLGPLALELLDSGAATGRLVVSFRGADVTSHLARHPERFTKLFARGDLFLPVSRAFRDVLIRRGCPQEKVVVHHSGVACDRFAYRDRTPVAGAPVRLLFVGRLAEKKGARYALEALATVHATGRRATLTLIGDGPLRSDLEGVVRTLDLGAQVTFAGRRSQSEVIGAMHDADILIAPSVTARSGDQEGIPNVVKEAMATGMPVVSTRHSGIPELVHDGTSGFLVPERDAAALADRLAWLIDHPERWPTLGRAGRAKIEEAFDVDRLNDELDRRYSELASNGGGT